MIARQMEDELEPLAVEELDRSELIARIRTLEEQRSVWELRIRACQERESLFLQFVNDMGAVMSATFQAEFDDLARRTQKVEEMMRMIQEMAKMVETV